MSIHCHNGFSLLLILLACDEVPEVGPLLNLGLELVKVSAF